MKFASFLLGLGASELAYAFVSQKTAFQRPSLELSAQRKPFITGNWKLNPATKQEAIALATEVANAVGSSSPGDVAIFVPFPFIECVQRCVGDKLNVGAEVSDRQ